MQTDDPRRCRFAVDVQSAHAHAARDDDLDHRPLLVARQRVNLTSQQLPFRRSNPQTRATAAETLQVQPETPGLTVEPGDSREQTVAVVQPAIARVDLCSRPAVDEDARAHQSRTPRARNRPRAFARVSASSRSGSESATMPAPARSD